MMKFVSSLFVAIVFGGVVDDINNNPTLTWRAVEYPPEVITFESMRARLIRPWKIELKHKWIGSAFKAADSFDARDKWEKLILSVRDQQKCGSSWAFAVAETTGDRVGIVQGASNGDYSPQDLVSCDTSDYGCDGGYVDTSWQYVLETGLALEACIPYTSGKNGEDGECPVVCANGSAIVRTKAAKVYPVPYAQMQDDLQTYGPFEVQFLVYADFMNYKSGVYQHKLSDMPEGGLAVLLVGWGTDSGVPYWIVQNVWGSSWGMDGFFWILRGSNECGIEDNAYAARFS